ncbi:hypothetical protein CLV78_102756 [Aliiruegeria haliotis]|uniref:DUF1150 family protein n=1 Tax=Aliiruegeria haliotis TaxID=1280846 RepID=A0A2T0RWK6_9RHOB|nr:DUF1150 family protein [Aliiruegeria haliotis]PRY25576.1 hypothetical protein CLV78_102756 [Aliiruegeria haliotis]
MDYKHPIGEEQGIEIRPIVYVRPVDVTDLPEDIRDQAEGVDELYAVHTEEGERIALVQGRELAFVLARENDMEPVNVH